MAHTPYRENGGIDEECFARQVEWAYSLGAQGICLALASDLFRLARRERVRLGRVLAAISRGRGPVIISSAAQDADAAKDYAREAIEAGCSAIMAIPPLNGKESEEELESFFAELAGMADLPLIVQDASGYLGRPLTIEMQVRLLDRFGPEKIMFKPESVPLVQAMVKIREATGGRARILEGSGGAALAECHSHGIVGTIPGCDLLDGILALWRALEAGDGDTVRRLHAPISAIGAIQMRGGLDGFLTIERYLMKRRGLFRTDATRPPVNWSPNRETLSEVERHFEELKAALPG